MTRYTLTLPLADNAGLPLDRVHASLADALLDIAGGWTAGETTGAWRGDDGRVYREAGRVYALDTADPDALPRLLDIARSVAIAAGQEAVYVTAQPIGTYLVTPTAVEA